MHELSICQALLTQVALVVGGRAADAVERITIEVGPLSGVDSGLLQRAFAVLRAGGLCDDAELSVQASNVIVACAECGVRTATPPNRLVCGECGGFRTAVVQGAELRLLRVEIRVADPVSASLVGT